MSCGKMLLTDFMQKTFAFDL